MATTPPLCRILPGRQEQKVPLFQIQFNSKSPLCSKVVDVVDDAEAEPPKRNSQLNPDVVALLLSRPTFADFAFPSGCIRYFGALVQKSSQEQNNCVA